MPEVVLIAVPPVLGPESVEIDSVAHFLLGKHLLVLVNTFEDFPNNLLVLW
jgi:hypothetical protein